MKRFLIVLLLSAPLSFAEESAEENTADEVATDASALAETSETNAPVKAANNTSTPSQPRAMSGMSILGNEEAPKSLVIIPWKSSEMGDELSLSENLDDRAQPVDKDVFLRELEFYEIRKSD